VPADSAVGVAARTRQRKPEALASPGQGTSGRAFTEPSQVVRSAGAAAGEIARRMGVPLVDFLCWQREWHTTKPAIARYMPQDGSETVPIALGHAARGTPPCSLVRATGAARAFTGSGSTCSLEVGTCDAPASSSTILSATSALPPKRVLVDRHLRHSPAFRALSRALLPPAEMLVIERKRGLACAAGSGGMEQPDRPWEGGVTLPRLGEPSGLRDGL
jgi:hypothetical protein